MSARVTFAGAPLPEFQENPSLTNRLLQIDQVVTKLALWHEKQIWTILLAKN